jgi:hypothetical protein
VLVRFDHVASGNCFIGGCRVSHGSDRDAGRNKCIATSGPTIDIRSFVQQILKTACRGALQSAHDFGLGLCERERNGERETDGS